jgi:hypothetical protein
LSKKTVLGNRISYCILSETKGLVTPGEICKKHSITKQRVNYWLKKFRKAEWITSPYHGEYEITNSGKTILDTYEQGFNKNLIRLENMRYLFPISEGVEQFLEIAKDRWEKNNGMKNVDVYYTKIHGYSVSAYLGKNPSLTINCISRLGLDIYEMMYEARTEVEILAEIIEKDYSIVLGRMKTIVKPEWAIPSEFAKVLLNKTNSSQIRTPNGVINKSKGRGYDIETRDIILANKLYNLPYVVDEIVLQLKHLRAASNTGLFSL